MMERVLLKNKGQTALLLSIPPPSKRRKKPLSAPAFSEENIPTTSTTSGDSITPQKKVLLDVSNNPLETLTFLAAPMTEEGISAAGRGQPIDALTSYLAFRTSPALPQHKLMRVEVDAELLEIFFASSCCFDQFPRDLFVNCPNLKMVAFRANAMRQFELGGGDSSLAEMLLGPGALERGRSGSGVGGASVLEEKNPTPGSAVGALGEKVSSEEQQKIFDPPLRSCTFPHGDAIVPIPNKSPFPHNLCWLILTSNKLTKLPDDLGGSLPNLQKVLLAGNRLSALPVSMRKCRKLELLRLNDNCFAEDPPSWLFALPKLAWLGLSGNPRFKIPEAEGGCSYLMEKGVDVLVDETQELGRGNMSRVVRGQWLQVGAKNGAGEVLPPRSLGPVAVKLFNEEILSAGGGAMMSSDGNVMNELGILQKTKTHPNLVRSLGLLIEARPDSGKVEKNGKPWRVVGSVLAPLEEGCLPLGGAPNFDTVARDTFPLDQELLLTRATAPPEGVSPPKAVGTVVDLKVMPRELLLTRRSVVAQIFIQLLDAVAHLWHAGVTHADVYCHNVTGFWVDPHGEAAEALLLRERIEAVAGDDTLRSRSDKPSRAATVTARSRSPRREVPGFSATEKRILAHGKRAVKIYLTDFGAATWLDPENFKDYKILCSLEKLEVRALGNLLDDLLTNYYPEAGFAAPEADKVLIEIRDRCLEPDVEKRIGLKALCGEVLRVWGPPAGGSDDERTAVRAEGSWWRRGEGIR